MEKAINNLPMNKIYPLRLSGWLLPAAYGSSVDGSDAKYSRARWIAGGIGGGVGKWSPYNFRRNKKNGVSKIGIKICC